MKKLIPVLMMVLVLAICAPVAAQDPILSLQGALYLKTTLIASTDTSTKFTSLYATAYGSTVDWQQVKAVTITCETNDARIAFGAAAENDGTPVGHILAATSSVRFASRDLVQNMYIISKTAGSPASLQCTLEK